ncbi:MAG: hydroxymethylbilane synthase, partial [Methanoregula sp.]
VDTRVRKLSEGQFHAVVLAEAGLSRLGIRIPGERLPPETFVPTANQGTIAVVSRADPSLMEVLSALDHSVTRKDVAIERAVMEQIGAGCFTPMGIYCKNGHLIAEVLSLDGKRTERIEKNVGTLDEARAEGTALRSKANELIADAYHTLGISL